MAAALPQFVADTSCSQANSSQAAEFSLLFACCADISEAERKERIGRAIEHGINWDSLAVVAGHHGVLPLVSTRLTFYRANVPPDALEILKRLEQVNSRRALWLTNQLLQVAEHLEKHKIGFLAYKGPTLGQMLYKNVAARQFGDIDILVHPTDVERALGVVRGLGYGSQLNLTRAQEQAYLSIGYEYSLDSDFGRNLLEIKWQMLPRFYAIDFDLHELFANAASVHLGGRTIPSLRAEDLLLVLCVHAAKHGWEKLSWLRDIAALSKSDSLDWDTICRRARKMGIERILAINFVLIGKFFNTFIPRPISSYLRSDLAIEPMAGKIANAIVNCQNCDFSKRAYFSEFARLRERKTDRARFWWRLLTTPSVSEWKTANIGNPRSPVYRGIRMYRLAVKMIGTRS